MTILALERLQSQVLFDLQAQFLENVSLCMNTILVKRYALLRMTSGAMSSMILLLIEEILGGGGG